MSFLARASVVEKTRETIMLFNRTYEPYEASRWAELKVFYSR